MTLAPSPQRQLIATRYRIGLLLAAAIAISYLDRQTLPIAIKSISREIPISETQFSSLNTAFLLAYAAMYMGGGRLVDFLGARRGFLVIMIFWSLACASHGLATGLWFLAGCRFALGLGEGGGFPAAVKAIAEWFPASERSLALGLLNCGLAVGSVSAPPLIALVIGWLDWRFVFFFAGALGILWALWWIISYYPPAQHPRISSVEREMIEAAHRTAGEEAGVTGGIRWIELFSLVPTWGLLGAKFLSDAAWFIYATWLAKYLFSVHGFDTKQVGYYAWIPYAAAGVGSLSGGALATWLMHRGRSAGFSRKLAMALAALLMPSVILVTLLPVKWAIVVFSVVFFGHQAWSSNLIVLPTDIYPRRIVGSIAGLMGCSGALGGVIFGEFVGTILQKMGPEKGYTIVFAAGGCFHMLSLGLILLTIPKVKMLSMSAPIQSLDKPA